WNAELIPFLVAAQIARRHVEADCFLERILARVPDIGRAEIAAQQADHIVEDDGAGVGFRTQPFQARDDIAEQAQFAAADIANDRRHPPPRRPTTSTQSSQWATERDVLGREQACQDQEALARAAASNRSKRPSREQFAPAAVPLLTRRPSPPSQTSP